MISGTAFFPRCGRNKVDPMERSLVCIYRHLDQIDSMKLPQLLLDSPKAYLSLSLYVSTTRHSSFSILFI